MKAEEEVRSRQQRDTRSNPIKSGEWSGGGEGRGHGTNVSENRITGMLRAVSLRTLLLDIHLDIPIYRGRGCASHLRQRICNVTLIGERQDLF